MTTDSPYYRNEPIGSIGSLSRALGQPPERLFMIAERAHTMYPQSITGSYVKEDGSPRICYNPAPPVKQLHQKMIEAIFNHVTFPFYINGGIKERSYRDSCALHVRAKTVVNLDISSFFESVSHVQVRRLWQHFFNFPPEVADLLTALTTYKGHLPRGAPASSYLGNLIFWDLEPRLVTSLCKEDIVYSRYIDDVALSAKRRLKPKDLQPAIRQVYGMFARKDVKPNRDKQRISHKDRGHTLRVHRINVCGDVPTIPKEIRKEIRAEVHQLKLAMQQPEFSRTSDLMTHARHVYGRVAWLNRFHPEQAAKLKGELPSHFDQPYELY